MGVVVSWAQPRQPRDIIRESHGIQVTTPLRKQPKAIAVFGADFRHQTFWVADYRKKCQLFVCFLQ